MKKSNWLLLFIFLLAFFLRFTFISRFPATLYGDEQAFAWNAYNILKTGNDEYGSRLPLEFRSFDDYKAPVGVYLLVPFIKIFGLNALGIRLPVVILGALSIFPAYLLGRLIFSAKKSLAAAFLLAVSPWHIHLSRGYFEAVLALFFYCFGLFFFLRSVKVRGQSLIWSAIFFTLTVYTYFTPRILLPGVLIFLLIFIYVNRKNREEGKLKFFLKFQKFFLVLIILSIPLIITAIKGPGLSRLNKLSGSLNTRVVETVNRERKTSKLPQFWQIALHNKFTVKTRIIKDNIFEQLSLNFWYLYGDSSLRYSLGKMGMFYLMELPLLLIGFMHFYQSNRKNFYLLSILIILATVPAGLVDRPFAVRSLGILPFPFYFVSEGINRAINFNRQKLVAMLKLVLPLTFAFSLLIVLTRYYFEYPEYAATWWGYENKKALDLAGERENSYQQIFISDFYSGAPLAFAVYHSLDPLEYRYSINNPVFVADGRKMIKIGKYYFGSLDINKERLSQKIIPPQSLYIGRPEELGGEEQIVAPEDGRLLFVIHDTLKKDCYLKNLPSC